jgi:hypothetical protein
MSLDGYANTLSAMWDAMRVLEPGEFMRFTGHAAGEITACVDQVPITENTDDDTLRLILPMPFAEAMAVAHTQDRPAGVELPQPIAGFLEEAAAACRRVAARDAAGTFAFPIGLGDKAAAAVKSLLSLPPSESRGIDVRAYLIWSIYRSYVEVVLDSDPLPPETERAALALFQSGQRIAGVA